jgi:phosphohistidine phosphatase
MARQLWLLRHGEAEPHDAREDAARRLTPRGERQAQDAGAALAALGVELTAAYTSPRVRALDTAKLACEALGVEPSVDEALSGGWGADEARALMEGHDADARVLVVGHEPDFSQVVHDLTGGRIDLKKGGVAAVRLDGTGAELFDLLRPKELEAIAATGDRP